jgi:TldD protein
MSNRTTRRDFLAVTSLACAGTFLGTRGLSAQVLPARIGVSALSADALLPDPLAPDVLRALAMQAVDAAKSAGASYADVRVAERHRLKVDAGVGIDPVPTIVSTITFGVRVIASGRMAFVHGNTPSADAVTAAARNAVTDARGYGRATTRPVELAQAPVVTGEWETPYREDPFTVPLRDQWAVCSAFLEASNRVREGNGMKMASLGWTRERRVFASSEGALLTQTLRRAKPETDCVSYRMQYGFAGIGFPLLRAQSGGFETVNDPSLLEAFKRHVEYVVELNGLPHRTLDVGRYPVVFDGRTLGMVLGRTLGPALELDRILGFGADAEGTSFITPPAEFLGQAIASSLLTVKCNRAMPSVTAVKWDDEGVEAREYPLITAGKLDSFHASRQTVAALGASEGLRGAQLQPQGCALASDAGEVPLVRTPHLTVSPGQAKASLEDLYKGMTKGILVLDMKDLTTDHQCANNILIEPYGMGNMLLIEKGKIVGKLKGNALQFATKSLWTKQLMALGDTSTVYDYDFETQKGMPWKSALQSTRAPAGLFKDVDVISTEISL